MAGRADILAGRSYVELLLKDKGFSSGLDAAGAKFKSVGKGMAIVGAAITGAGAAIVTPLLEMTREFAATAAGIFNMSQRTHESTANLELMAYAAQETGTEIEKVQQAIFKTQKEGKNFDQLAAQVASIQDPAKQSEKAIELFGKKAGPFIVPLLRQLPELKARFDELGLAKGLSEKDVATGKKLNSTFLDLTEVIKSARNVIGAALAPTVKAATDVIIGIAKSIRDWIDEHRELFVTLLKVGTALIGVGAAITVLGGIVAATGFAFTGISTALGVMASVLGAIVSPIGLAVAAVAGLATWFATSTESGQAMVTSLKGWFSDLLGTAEDTFGGIADALSAGDISLAAKVLWAGLNVLWLEGTEGIRGIWYSMTDSLAKAWFTVVAGVEEVWNEVSSALEIAWSATTEFLTTAWDTWISGFKKAWNDAVAFFQTTWLRIKGLFGSDVKAEIARINAAVDTANKKLDGDAAQKAADRNAAGQKSRDETRANRAKRLDDIGANLANNTAGADKDQADKLAAAQKALTDAQAELAKMKATAAKEREDKEQQKPEQKAAQIPTSGALKQQIFGSYSAAALTAGGGSAEPPDVKAIREGNKQRQEALKVAHQQHTELMKLNVSLACHV